MWQHVNCLPERKLKIQDYNELIMKSIYIFFGIFDENFSYCEYYRRSNRANQFYHAYLLNYMQILKVETHNFFKFELNMY